MVRRLTWLLAALAIAGRSAADDNLLKFWDAPRRETFAMKKATAQEAAMEVRRRFGFEFDLDGSIVDAIDFKAKDATFLEALDRLGGPLGLYVVGVPLPEAKRDWLQRGLALVRPDAPIAPAIFAHVGPSRISVESVSLLAVARCAPEPGATLPGMLEDGGIPIRIRRIFRPQAAERPALRVHLRWIVEPGFEDVVMMGLALGQVQDDRGEPVKTQHDPSLPIAANGELELDFERPSRKAKSLKKVQANARFGVPTERGEISFLPTEAGVTRTLGHASVTLEGVDSAAVPPTASFALTGTPSGLSFGQGLPTVAVSTGRFRNEIPALTVIAYDAKGAEVQGHERESSWDDKLARGTYKIEFAGAPARLVFKAITNVAVREGQFTLNAIPIPE